MLALGPAHSPELYVTISPLVKGVSLAQRSARHAQLFLLHLVTIKHLTAQC